MIDIITSYVYNGSVIGDFSYVEWLPFYDYGYYLFGICVVYFILKFLKQSFMSTCLYILFESSLLVLPVLYVLTRFYTPTPSDIYQWWVIIQFIIYFIIALIRSIIRIGEFQTKEEYVNHIKEKHPDIHDKYFGEKEDEH